MVYLYDVYIRGTLIQSQEKITNKDMQEESLQRRTRTDIVMV